MARIPIGRILGLTGAGGLGGALGYGISRRHDFAVVKAKTPNGQIYLTGQRGDINRLRQAAKSGDTKTFADASKRVFVLGGGGVQGMMRRTASLADAMGFAKTAAGKGSLLTKSHLLTGALGLAGGAAAAGIPIYGAMRGREFSAMNIQTPSGPIPVAGQRRRLNEIVDAAKKGDPNKFRQALSKVLPLHPGMAPLIQKQSSLSKLSALNASFFVPISD